MWGEIVNGLRMDCAFPRERYARGARITLIIKTQNANSSEPLSFVETNPLLNYDVQVIGPNEQVLELTPAAIRSRKSAADGEIARQMLVTLELKETYEQNYPLSKAFALTESGQYTIMVSRPEWSAKEGTLSSGPINLTIT